jgi:hypothetical protein
VRPASLVLVAAAVGCGNGAGAPPTDTCPAASAGTIDALAVGAASAADLAGMPSPFVPLADGDGVPLIRGGQGAYMVGFILRVSGSAAPDCLAERTVVTDPGGARIASSTAPLATYAQPDGTRLTHPLWLPGDYPLQFAVRIDAADKSLSLSFHFNLAK